MRIAVLRCSASALHERRTNSGSRSANLSPLHANRYRDFVAKPHPEITVEGPREVIDAVWDSKHCTQPKGAPENYMDLAYLAKA